MHMHMPPLRPNYTMQKCTPSHIMGCFTALLDWTDAYGQNGPVGLRWHGSLLFAPGGADMSMQPAQYCATARCLWLLTEVVSAWSQAVVLPKALVGFISCGEWPSFQPTSLVALCRTVLAVFFGVHQLASLATPWSGGASLNATASHSLDVSSPALWAPWLETQPCATADILGLNFPFFQPTCGCTADSAACAFVAPVLTCLDPGALLACCLWCCLNCASSAVQPSSLSFVCS